jgi:DNA-binding beta-propeller fold protein YncE
VDGENHQILKISTHGVVSILAGSGRAEWGDGYGTQAHFNHPRGVAVDGDGNIIVADYGNHRIRKISPDGNVSTLAGSGKKDFGDGQGAQAHFNCPHGVAVDGEGNIIVADRDNHCIRKISPDGNVSTLAGTGKAGSPNKGLATEAKFNNPSDVAVDSNGNIIVADSYNECIRIIEYQDGRGYCVDMLIDNWDASVCVNPISLTVDGQGFIVWVNQESHKVYVRNPETKQIHWLAGKTAGFENGDAKQALFRHPSGVAVDKYGNILVADTGNKSIRIISAGLTPPLPMASPAKELSRYETEMRAMLYDTRFSDVTFLVGNDLIHAHRIILAARSDYFRAMLTSGLSETQEPPHKRARSSGQEEAAVITINDTTPEVFRALLRYLYTDELCFDGKDLMLFAQQAHMLSLDELYEWCEREVEDTMSTDNAVKRLLEARQYTLCNLQAYIISYVARNWDTIIEAPDFEHNPLFDRENRDLCVQIIQTNSQSQLKL